MQHNEVIDGGKRRSKRRITWVLFLAFGAASIGISVFLQRLVSPVGDAFVASARERDRQLTGLLIAKDTGAARFAIYDGVTYFPVRGQVPERLVGRKVTVTAVFNRNSGLLEVSDIHSAD